MAEFSILIVDDDPMVLRSLEQILARRGYVVVTASEPAMAEARLGEGRFDIILLDINLPGKDGIEFLRELRRDDPEYAVVMMTAFASVDTAVSALRLGATDYIIKPFEFEQLELVIGRIAERKRLLSANQEFLRGVKSQYDFSRIVTMSPRFLELIESLKKVVATNTTILITGESGTGKELVARAVHTNSPRSDLPLIAVNCAAIPATLMEAELFGHVKGAFTGAVGDRKGYFERADGSTLFLDEIGELNIDLQVKLLRVLQERQISRVGDPRPVGLDFRLIAATQRDLTLEVKEGRFRQDLYYRLSVFPVSLPPLRERPEDVEPLIANCLKKLGRGDLEVSAEALELMRRYSWPGNVRELENVIERAALLSDSVVIGPMALAPELRGGGSGSAGGLRVEIPAETSDYKQVLREVGSLARRKLIGRALRAHQGNVTHSARALGMSRRHLITMMRELGIKFRGGEEC
ncbi:MAG TPA: sigma-54 dependent transcriptional regulator [bacterium]|nr:sigma-54 dependent transcriptional regulator [bacterium]